MPDVTRLILLYCQGLHFGPGFKRVGQTVFAVSLPLGAGLRILTHSAGLYGNAGFPPLITAKRMRYVLRHIGVLRTVKRKDCLSVCSVQRMG